jgi:ribosomal protein S18 acetylase RimI-like enzyme
MLELWKVAGIKSGSMDEMRAMRTRLRRDRDLFLVACQGPRLVGTLIAGWDGWRGSMARLAVDPSYRRQRVAHRLVQAAEARLWKKGAKRIGALVFSDNMAGEQFWLAAGYAPEPNIRRFVKTRSS